MVSPFKIRIKRGFFYGIVLLLIVILSSPFMITHISNTSYIKNKISSFIYQKTGTHLDASKFSLTLFPQTSFNINNFNLHPGNKLDVHIESLKFDITLQELFQGKINFDKITIERPTISLIHQKEGQSAVPVDFSVSKYIQELKKLFDFLPEHQNSAELLCKNVKSPYFNRMDGSLFFSKKKQRNYFKCHTNRYYS